MLIVTLENTSIEAGAQITNRADDAKLQRLVDLARQRWSQAWRGLDMEHWARVHGLRGLEKLSFGATEVVLQIPDIESMNS